MSDLNQIWKAIKTDDLNAFEELFREMSSSMYCFAFKLVRDKEKAEEIVHDVFIKLWTLRSQIEIKTSLKAYLFRSVHNLSVNWLISNRTKKGEMIGLADEETWKRIIRTCECNSFLIELLETKQLESRIEKIIDELPEQCRKVFKLSRFDGKSVREISEQLKLSQSTVKTHLSLALERIKNKLNKNSN